MFEFQYEHLFHHDVTLPHEGKAFTVYVGMKDGEVIASAKVEPVQGLDALDKVAFVSGVFVTPKFQRKGVATMMMGQIHFQCRERGYRRSLLYVHRENDAAIRLYGGLHYKTIMDAGDGDILMCKFL